MNFVATVYRNLKRMFFKIIWNSYIYSQVTFDLNLWNKKDQITILMMQVSTGKIHGIKYKTRLVHMYKYNKRTNQQCSWKKSHSTGLTCSTRVIAILSSSPNSLIAFNKSKYTFPEQKMSFFTPSGFSEALPSSGMIRLNSVPKNINVLWEN